MYSGNGYGEHIAGALFVPHLVGGAHNWWQVNRLLMRSLVCAGKRLPVK